MLSRLAVISACLAPIFYILDGYAHTQYVFVPEKLQAISRDAIALHGNDTEPLLREITRQLRLEYGGAVTEWSRDDWFFNNAGGAMVNLSSPFLYLILPQAFFLGGQEKKSEASE